MFYKFRPPRSRQATHQRWHTKLRSVSTPVLRTCRCRGAAINSETRALDKSQQGLRLMGVRPVYRYGQACHPQWLDDFADAHQSQLDWPARTSVAPDRGRFSTGKTVTANWLATPGRTRNPRNHRAHAWRLIDVNGGVAYCRLRLTPGLRLSNARTCVGSS
jgi:hypothetical protein